MDVCPSCGCYIADWYQHTTFHHWLVNEIELRINERLHQLTQALDNARTQ